VDHLIASSDLRDQPAAGGAAVQVLQSGPAHGGDRLLQMMTTLLFAARGVEVVLVVPEKVDSRLVRYARRSAHAPACSPSPAPVAAIVVDKRQQFFGCHPHAAGAREHLGNRQGRGR
jgi:hypothetical protein